MTGTEFQSFSGRRVLITGHTGFKGSWLSIWLRQLGAHVIGLSLPPEEKSLYRAAQLDELVDGRHGDIRDGAVVQRIIGESSPELVVHLAAQPLVIASYDEPVKTYETNVMGTLHVLEACRRTPSITAVLVITSDKSYENREWPWPYRETDPMGGHDPYSSSKGCAELAVASWRRSFFVPERRVYAASARAGNVIGGGDWAVDRLIPDCVRAMFADTHVSIRNPGAIRPWQHVLDALAGYLLLCERLLKADTAVCEAWNFGPGLDDIRPVSDVVAELHARWPTAHGWQADAGQRHEAWTLTLDSSKARQQLGWRPRLDFSTAIAWTADWYAREQNGENALALCQEQIAGYAEKGSKIS